MANADLLFRAGLDNEAFNAGIGKMLKNVAAFGAGFLTLGTAVNLLKDMAQKAEANETATMGLASAVKSLKTGTEAGFIALNSYASKMSEITGIAQTDLKDALKTLVYETGSVSASQASLTAAIDISRARHVSLEVAAKAVGKAYEGNITMLKRWGIELEHGESGMKAINDLTKKFGGAEDSYLATTAGKLQVAQNDFNLLENELGQNFLPALGNAAKALAYFLEGFTDVGQKRQLFEQEINNLTAKLNQMPKNLLPGMKGWADAGLLKAQIKEVRDELNKLGGAFDDTAFAAKTYTVAIGTATQKDEEGAAQSKIRAVEFSDVGKALNDLASLSRTKNKELFAISKAASIGAIIANTAENIMKIGAQLGVAAPPFQIAAGVEGATQLAVAAGSTFSAASGLYADETMISTFSPREMVIPQRFSDLISSGKFSLHGGTNSTTNNSPVNINIMGADRKSARQIALEIAHYFKTERGGRLVRADGSMNM